MCNFDFKYPSLCFPSYIISQPYTMFFHFKIEFKITVLSVMPLIPNTMEFAFQS